MKSKARPLLFKDHPAGLMLHAGRFRSKPVWHSEDGGKTWWSGCMFSHTAKVTRAELVEIALTVLYDVFNKEARKCKTSPG